MLLQLKSPIINQDMEKIYKDSISWQQLNNKKIYITGANGMIASYMTLFLIYLNETKGYGIQIYAKVRNPQKLTERFGEYTDRDYFHVVLGDMSEPIHDDVKPNYIIHAASLASPQYYGIKPVETMLPNIVGTNEVLKLAKRSNSESILFFSSGSVYGKVGDVDELTEDTLGNLNFLELGNSYGESKRCGEALCNAYFSEYGVPVKTARIHHTYGPSMDYKNDQRVFSEFIKNIVEGKEIVIKSDGKDKRAFCYISDTVTALYKVMLNGLPGQVYNVANTNEYVSISELADKLCALQGAEKSNVIYKQRNRDELYCPSSVKRVTPVSCEKLSEMGWSPCVSITDGFQRTLDYILEDYDGEKN